MKVYELIEVSESALTKLSSAGVATNDVRHIEMYRDFSKMKSEGQKIVYVVNYLADYYDVSERYVYSIIKKFEQEVE